ncbi:acetylornithine deacetylase [Oceanibacterium hippocampi]|uniref:Acetylornithine deacetylase n=1 Tax=Oceanibacterium hippocampi TaxID=745714 RepID=A0A1Y5RY13_9PROT|nr:acetylornithine deacetylase [Oceanibacterium hippocampi]SLN25536.1 Acetylornithine deacetylase [Oceanibacterium hippocampi]
MATALTSRQLVETLVGFDTTSFRSNLQLIEWVADYLSGFGIESRLIPDETGQKANLYAVVGPADKGGIVLSGHSDVVPVEGQPWDSDPFTVVERDGRLFGRGTADMKSFIACSLALVPELVKRPLKTPVRFAFSYDEEIGCVGVHGVIRHIEHDGPVPEIVIVGEPTEMKVVNAHKGTMATNTTVRGLEAHSSAPQTGVNAIAYAAELVAWLGRTQEELIAGAPADSPFVPPYTTINVGTIKGGTARNIIPRECTFQWDCRSIPEDDGPTIRRRFDDYAEQVLLPRMRAIHPGAEIVSETRATVTPLRPETDSPAEALVKRLAGRNDTEVVSYATEGGLFQGTGSSTVVCGPGNIREAHKPNEWIALDQIAACDRFMRRLAEHVREN